MGKGGKGDSCTAGASATTVFRPPETKATDNAEDRKRKLDAEVKKALEEKAEHAKIEELNNKRLALEEMEKQRQARIKKLGIDNEGKYNYAICGMAGVGKSSLLNAVLKMDPRRKGAATGYVETTMVIKSYSVPFVPRLMLWDLPGAGTIDHPRATYYEDKVLHAFDAIFIVTGERITEDELEIAVESKNAGKPVLFVRSKVDRNLREMAEDEGVTMAEAAAKFRTNVDEYFRNQMHRKCLENVNMSLVSSKAFFTVNSPYKLGSDKSLGGMDEGKIIEFILETAASRFPPTDEQRRNKEIILQELVTPTGSIPVIELVTPTGSIPVIEPLGASS